MSENVVQLGKADVTSARREAFLLTVAQSFELYVTTHGHEPDAVVFTLAGICQPSLIGWQVEGVSRDGVTSVLSMAAVHTMAEAQQARQGL